MKMSEAIRERRSIRKYKPNIEIPQEDIDLMLKAAMMAPSAMTMYPWEFVVVRSKEIREQMISVHPDCYMIKDASLAIVVCGRPELQNALSSGFWPQDCGAATENILLQAVELGYGTCWCGEYPFSKRITGLQQVLDVTSIPFSVIAVGVPDENPKARGYYEKEKVKYLK
mgnify:CR=1 FL=1